MYKFLHNAQKKSNNIQKVFTFLCILLKLHDCNNYYKKITKDYKVVTTALLRKIENAADGYSVYSVGIIHIKELQKELRKELHLGAASSWSYVRELQNAMPLGATKSYGYDACLCGRRRVHKTYSNYLFRLVKSKNNISSY